MIISERIFYIMEQKNMTQLEKEKDKSKSRLSVIHM